MSRLDSDEIKRLIDRFNANQEAQLVAHRAVNQAIDDLQGRLDALERAEPTRLLGMLNVKNLGYELGRSLAAAELAGGKERPDAVRIGPKLCTQSDFQTGWLPFWCRELQTPPIYHRKIWEFCFIAQTLFAEGKLVPGSRGLGFGCGAEPLPSLFAKYGARILATDLGPDRPESEVWQTTAQHAAGIDAIRRPEICPDPALLANIGFEPLDMKAIPAGLTGEFDFCWSSCALEHLGSIAAGLDFIERSVGTLKPGGVAVHTTEFTLTEGATLDDHPVVLYQRRHVDELTERLRRRGYEVADFDFDPGGGILDRFVDLPPYGHELLIAAEHYAHLKLAIDGFVCTSAGLVVKVPQ